MAPTIETVQMDDGRMVAFPGKRKIQKNTIISDDGRVTTSIDFRNGRTLSFTIPDEMLSKFAAHGAEQKLGDECAGLQEVDDCALAVEQLIDRLAAGEWSMKREGGNGLAGTSVLMRALIEFTGKTPEDIKTFLANKTQAEKVALRNNPKIKPFVEKIEAEKASKGQTVDTEALLDELS